LLKILAILLALCGPAAADTYYFIQGQANPGTFDQITVTNGAAQHPPSTYGLWQHSALYYGTDGFYSHASLCGDSNGQVLNCPTGYTFVSIETPSTSTSSLSPCISSANTAGPGSFGSTGVNGNGFAVSRNGATFGWNSDGWTNNASSTQSGGGTIGVELAPFACNSNNIATGNMAVNAVFSYAAVSGPANNGQAPWFRGNDLVVSVNHSIMSESLPCSAPTSPPNILKCTNTISYIAIQIVNVNNNAQILFNAHVHHGFADTVNNPVVFFNPGCNIHTTGANCEANATTQYLPSSFSIPTFAFNWILSNDPTYGQSCGNTIFGGLAKGTVCVQIRPSQMQNILNRINNDCLSGAIYSNPCSGIDTNIHNWHVMNWSLDSEVLPWDGFSGTQGGNGNMAYNFNSLTAQETPDSFPFPTVPIYQWVQNINLTGVPITFFLTRQGGVLTSSTASTGYPWSVFCSLNFQVASFNQTINAAYCGASNYPPVAFFANRINCCGFVAIYECQDKGAYWNRYPSRSSGCNGTNDSIASAGHGGTRVDPNPIGYLSPNKSGAYVYPVWRCTFIGGNGNATYRSNITWTASDTDPGFTGQHAPSFCSGPGPGHAGFNGWAFPTLMGWSSAN
jgi:hypothetical protein